MNIFKCTLLNVRKRKMILKNEKHAILKILLFDQIDDISATTLQFWLDIFFFNSTCNSVSNNQVSVLYNLMSGISWNGDFLVSMSHSSIKFDIIESKLRKIILSINYLYHRKYGNTLCLINFYSVCDFKKYIIFLKKGKMTWVLSAIFGHSVPTHKKIIMIQYGIIYWK